MAKAKILTPDELRKRVEYDPTTGNLFWVERPVSDFATTPTRTAEVAARIWTGPHAGKIAFTGIGNGYRSSAILGVYYSAHRVAWALAKGKWPSGAIDHINGDKLDNRLCNLRDTTHAKNMQNRRVAAPPKSGVVGVYLHRDRGWKAQIGHNGKTIYLGVFATKEAAIAARQAAEIAYDFGPNHGLG